MSAYIGRPAPPLEGNDAVLCSREPGIVYSKGLLGSLKPYLPMCWPGQGKIQLYQWLYYIHWGAVYTGQRGEFVLTV